MANLTRHRSHSRLTALSGLVLAGALLAGCSGGDSDAPDAAGGDSSAEPSAGSGSAKGAGSPSGSPSGSGDAGGKDSAPASPSATAEKNTRPRTPADGLAAPSALPGLNDSYAWRDGATGDTDTESEPTGVCAKATLRDIGADRVAVRDYTPAADDQDSTARQVVARFVDARSAIRAEKVLRSWRRGCDQRLDYPVTKLNPLQKVAVPQGSGASYVVQYGPIGGTEAHRFDGLGIYRNGTDLVVTSITTQGMDYSYPPGEDPASQAVTAAARSFAG